MIRSFVTTLSGSKPIVEVPISDTDSPNVFVSVLAVRGRVGSFASWLSDMARRFDLPDFIPRDGGRPTALIDLSKPSYRLGAAEIRVGWKPHRLDVRVTADRPTYAVREQAHVKIHVARADGKPLPDGAEVAVAAVDEALLDLASNPSWNLLDAMMGERGLEVWTATAQMEVIGRRTFGRKAVPHGGGGGRERARELFDTLLTWQGRVTLDANGDAQLSIPLNDSLTSFRIVAVANAGSDLFGTGSTNVATTQDLMLLSGLPPVVREGDRYAATFTVRNTTTKAATVRATAKTSPALQFDLPNQQFDIAAGAARDIVWDVTAPFGAGSLAWNVSLETGGARDRLAVSQKVIPAIPVRTFQATLAQLDPTLSFAAERPADAIPGRGGLEISLQARLGDRLDGVRAFMDWYPYVCLEQQLSKAVALRDAATWDRWMEKLPAYLDRNGLLKYFASDRLDGDDTLTAYALAIANEADYAIPDVELTRMQRGLTDFIEGRIDVRSALQTSDLSIRKLAAIEALSRYDAAEPRMLDSISIDPNLWPTSAVLDWLSILSRVQTIPNRDARIAEALAVIRARLNFQGTTMGFSTERTDALWWLMVSTDSNAARALLALMDRKEWREDIPRLVRGVIGRQQRGHWNTTVANAWGTLALEKFSAAFERTPVTGETRLTYGPLTKSLVWNAKGDDLTGQLPWQDTRQPVSVTQLGTGRPWATIRANAALPLKAPLSSGFTITRTVTPVEQQVAGAYRRGDVVRVHIDVDAQSDMTWVVVDDPIPAGATVLGSGLGGQSNTLTQGERAQGAGMARVRTARVRRLPRLLPIRAEGPFQHRIHGAFEQPRHLPAAADTRRSDVRAGNVRRTAERARYGGAEPVRTRALSVSGTLVTISVVLVAISGFVAWLTYADVPDFATVRARWQSSEAYLLDRHGVVIDSARIDYGVRRFQWVPLDSISTALVDAVVDGEDHRFWTHSGIDWRAALGALRTNLTGEHRRGASTITMQLAAMIDPASAGQGSRRGWYEKVMQARAAARDRIEVDEGGDSRGLSEPARLQGRTRRHRCRRATARTEGAVGSHRSGEPAVGRAASGTRRKSCASNRARLRTCALARHVGNVR